MFICRGEVGGAKSLGQAASVCLHPTSLLVLPPRDLCAASLGASLSVVTRVHFLSAHSGDAGCLLQFGGAAFSLVQHPNQESTAPIFQNQVGEGNEIHTTHTHLPREPGQCWPHAGWQGTNCLPECTVW